MSYRVFYGNFAFFFGNHSGQYCFHFLGLLLSNSIFQSNQLVCRICISISDQSVLIRKNLPHEMSPDMGATVNGQHTKKSCYCNVEHKCQQLRLDITRQFCPAYVHNVHNAYMHLHLHHLHDMSAWLHGDMCTASASASYALPHVDLCTWPKWTWPCRLTGYAQWILQVHLYLIHISNIDIHGWLT